MARGLFSGLAALHARGVLHRGLSPASVATDVAGNAVLADVGLSALLDQAASASAEGGCGGPLREFGDPTRAWLALESVRTGRCERASDVAAGGMLLFFMLTRGAHPYSAGFSAASTAAARVRFGRGGRHAQLAALQAAAAARSGAGAVVPGTTCDDLENNLRLGRLTGLGLLAPLPAAQHLVGWMLDMETRGRPTATQVLAHPFFWDEGKRYDFLCMVGNQEEVKTSGKQAAFAFSRAWQGGGGAGAGAGDAAAAAAAAAAASAPPQESRWDTVVGREIFSYHQESQGVFYDVRSPLHLLRFIRNSSDLCGHSGEVPAAVRRTFDACGGIHRFFLRKFPHLLVQAWRGATASGWHDRRVFAQHHLPPPSAQMTHDE